MPVVETHSVKISKVSEPGKGMRQHKTAIESGAVQHQRMVPQRLYKVTVEQADKCSGTPASGTVESEKTVCYTGGNGNMWQEHIIKQYPCHKAYSQENASQTE